MKDFTHDLSVNDEKHRLFANAVGYAILNCANIELFTFSYLAYLSGTSVFETGLSKALFTKRLHRIRKLLGDAEIEETLRRRAFAIWHEAEKIMKWRNIVAHNPITVIHLEHAHGVRDEYPCVINMANSKTDEISNLTLEDVDKIVRQSQRIASDLSACFAQLQEQLVSAGTQET